MDNLLRWGEIDKESVSRIIIEITSIITALSTLLPSYLLILKKRQKENDEKELVSYSNRLKRAIIQNEPERENQKDSEIKEKKKLMH